MKDFVKGLVKKDKDIKEQNSNKDVGDTEKNSKDDKNSDSLIRKMTELPLKFAGFLNRIVSSFIAI